MRYDRVVMSYYSTMPQAPMASFPPSQVALRGVPLACPPMSGFSGTDDTTKTVVFGVVAVGVIGLVGYLLYKSMETRARVMEKVAEKEGTKGLLAYSAGETGLQLLSHAAMRRNARRMLKSR